ncbi:hypothetical protein Trydic_g6358 [Trypoxylus dichotomus]
MQCLSSLQYADDTATLVTSRNENVIVTKLNKSLEERKRYAEKRNIKINAGISEIISFSRKRPRSGNILWCNQRLKINNKEGDTWNWIPN